MIIYIFQSSTFLERRASGQGIVSPGLALPATRGRSYARTSVAYDYAQTYQQQPATIDIENKDRIVGPTKAFEVL